MTRIANADPVPFQPYTSEIPELKYCALSTPFSTSSRCNVPPVRSTCADIGDSYAAPTSLAGQETHARSLPLTAPFHFDTHPLRRSDFATDRFRPHPTAQSDRESYAPFRDAQYSLPDPNTHQASQARSGTYIRHTPDSASSPELVARMTRIANADALLLFIFLHEPQYLTMYYIRDMRGDEAVTFSRPMGLGFPAVRTRQEGKDKRYEKQ